MVYKDMRLMLTVKELDKLTDYLGITYPINWLNKISSYRTKNINLINRTIPN